MNITKLLVICFGIALLPLQLSAQTVSDASANGSTRNLQGWLDFLNQGSTVDSVVQRIGQPDKQKSVDAVAPDAQMYIWFNRFSNDVRNDNRLEMVAIPNNDPAGPRMLVIALVNPRTGRGVYMPWAWRYVDDAQHSEYISHALMQALID